MRMVLTIQRYGTTSLDCHQVHHSLGVEIGLANAQLLNCHIGKPRVSHLDRADIGRRAQHPDFDFALRGQKSGFARTISIVGNKSIVVKDDPSQRVRHLTGLRREEAIFQQTRQCVTLAAALTTADKDAGRSSNVVVDYIKAITGFAYASEETELRKYLVSDCSELIGVRARGLGEEGNVLDLVDSILPIITLMKECLPAVDLVFVLRHVYSFSREDLPVKVVEGRKRF